MDNYYFTQKGMEAPKTLEHTLEGHIANVEKGIFDPKDFTSDMKEYSFNEINPYKCVSKLIDLSKEKISGLTNYKILHNVEKMIDIIMKEYTIKKPGISEVLFFPNKANELKLIQYLKSAKQSISVCMFTVTNNHLSETLLEAHLKGIKVRYLPKIITESENIKHLGSDIPDLSKEGIPIRTDNEKRSLMHNKFVIIDERIIITGSYNWTSQATNLNEENIIVLENDEMAISFLNEFERLWKQFAPQNLVDNYDKDKKKTKLYLRYINNVKKQEESKKEKNEIKEIISQSKKISKIKKLHPTKSSTKLKSTKQKQVESNKPSTTFNNGLLNVFRVFFFLLYLFSLFGSSFLPSMNNTMVDNLHDSL